MFLKSMDMCSCTSPDAFIDLYKDQEQVLDVTLNTIFEENVKLWQ